jgi:restriction endonuclease S subunit
MMYYFMKFDAFTRQVDNVSASSATKLLNKTNFLTLSIHKPSVIEQEKIGNFLKAIDQKLKTEQNFLQKQQQIKVVLMNDFVEWEEDGCCKRIRNTNKKIIMAEHTAEERQIKVFAK